MRVRKAYPENLRTSVLGSVKRHIKFTLLALAFVIILSAFVAGCATPQSWYYGSGHPADYLTLGRVDNEGFQEALNALPSKGGTLYILEGQYKFEKPVTRQIDNIIIIGTNDTTLITNDNTTSLFIVGGKNWTFLNLRLDKGWIDYNGYNDVLLRNVEMVEHIYP